MTQLYTGRHLIHYGQVLLRDRADNFSVPEPTGAMPWIGHGGIVVPAANDMEIDVQVHDGGAEGPPPALPPELVSCVIEIGDQGIEVGNITTASTAHVPWPAGLTRVTVHAVVPDPTLIVFVLTPA